MAWRKYYEQRRVSALEAAKQIKSGQRVVVGHACGSPEDILEAMVERAGELRDVEIVHMVAMGKSHYCLPEYEKSFIHNSLFAGGTTRQALSDGRAFYTPCFFSQIPGLMSSPDFPIDVAAITVSPPDEWGCVSLGVSVDYTMAAANAAKIVIAEVNPNMPRTLGESFLKVEQIDYFVESSREILPLTPPNIGEVESAIGSNIASLVKDGDCLQLGIGAIPDAVLTFLKDKKDLGIHSEMISDGVMNLVDEGIVTGACKNIHKNKIVITFAMGSKKFYNWLSNNPQVEMHTVDYVNDPRIIGMHDNVVSINSALEVDLLGQIAADSLPGRQFSGVGGQVDFVRGAAFSKGGRCIIAMPSTASKGTVSRVSLALSQAQPVTTSRYDVQYVVTEHGIASLKGKNNWQRAKELINIAAPQFREELSKQCRDFYKFKI